MRIQIRSVNKATEMKIGDNGNGHTAHALNIDYLAEFYSRLSQKTVHTEVSLPENSKISDSSKAVFVESPWITSGVFKVNMPGKRPAVALRVFVSSPWIKTGVLKVNTPGNSPGLSVHNGGFKGSNAVFLRSPWITSFGIFPVEKMDHSIENSLRLVAVLVSMNQGRTPLAHLKAA
jgi:hypothetical protein